MGCLTGERRQSPRGNRGARSVGARAPRAVVDAARTAAPREARQCQIQTAAQRLRNHYRAAMSLAANPSESASTMQYEGSISSDGKFHGRGSIVYSNGERYAGEWQYGQRHGRGTYTYADGGTYSGDWERDKIQGEGTAKYSDDNVYTGSWTNGKIHGRGKLETAKFTYEGQLPANFSYGDGEVFTSFS